MRHRLRPFALIAVAVAGLAGLAAAQAAGKLGVINSQEILDRSAEGKRVQAELQAAEKKYVDDLARIDDQIKQLQNRLTTQRLTLTPEAAAGIQTDIQRKQTDRQRAAEDAARSMRELQTRTLERIQTELIALIEQARKDLGLELIFDLAKPGVFYFNPAINFTAEIVKRYDAMKAAPPAKK
jgi:outer membrane protein